MWTTVGQTVDLVAMNIRGLGADRLRLKLRLMSEVDLWSLFLHRREECSGEFWAEVENRKASVIAKKNVDPSTVSRCIALTPSELGRDTSQPKSPS